MDDFADAFTAAIMLIVEWDRDLAEIVVLSLQVSLAAVGLAAVVGLPAGAALALFRFPGRAALVVLMNALMGLPPVVVGLIVYLMLSRAGPLGVLGLLFTPAAMIIAQMLLVTPIIAALTRQVVEDLWGEYEEQLRSLGAGPGRTPDTVDVVFRLLGQVEVDHVGDIGHVDAACGHVGCHQNAQVAAAQRGQGAVTRALGHVAVQRAGCEASVRQALGQRIGIALGRGEDDGLLERGVAQQAECGEESVQRRADFMAHIGKKL